MIIESKVMIFEIALTKESKSRKRKRETDEGSPSAEAVSEANLKAVPPMVSKIKDRIL